MQCARSLLVLRLGRPAAGRVAAMPPPLLPCPYPYRRRWWGPQQQHQRRLYAAPPGPPTPRPAGPSRRRILTKDRLPQNDEITDDEILLVNDNGVVMSGPHSTASVMRRLDLNTHVLRMVSAAIRRCDIPPPTPPELLDPNEPPPPPPEPRPALCHIIDKEAEYKARRAAKQRVRETGVGQKKKVKEIEMGWNIAQNDLERKAGQVVGFLERGMRVELIMSAKRGSRKAGEEDAATLVDRVRDMLVEERGAREIGKPSGRPGRTVKMCFEGVVSKPPREPGTEAGDGEGGGSGREVNKGGDGSRGDGSRGDGVGGGEHGSGDGRDESGGRNGGGRDIARGEEGEQAEARPT